MSIESCIDTSPHLKTLKNPSFEANGNTTLGSRGAPQNRMGPDGGPNKAVIPERERQ